MKLTVAFLLIVFTVATNAQFGAWSWGGGGAPQAGFYQSLLEQRLQKLLATPNFPQDLEQRALDTVSNASTGFETCNSTVHPAPWLQRICIVRQYSAAQNALKAIEDEATARAQATTAATN